MNLLPKHEKSFSDKQYWDLFFKNRHKKSFEWYGEYEELCSLLYKYMKFKDNILVVGCGNSNLSPLLYDTGFRSIMNIDVSAIAIKQMKHKHADKPGMTFQIMDALNTSFENDNFSVVLDKGTLDALMTQDTPEDVQRGRELLLESARVLKFGGRYIVISLLQPHILRTILEVYSELGWMIRICRCREVEERTFKETGHLRMAVFMVVCTKLKSCGQSILELNLCGGSDKPRRVGSIEEVARAVRECQDAVAMCREIQSSPLNEEVEMEFRRDSDATARYTLYVLDTPEGMPKYPTYAALIVPHGREYEWMFGTPEGRQLLRKSSNFDRLTVICLSREHKYASLEEIQAELSCSILQLAPNGCPSDIPYVTIADGLGHRELVYSGKSEFSGEFVVEDVTVGANRFRRLIFLSNRSVMQSEALMKRATGDETKWEVDTSHIGCSYYSYMAMSGSLYGSSLNSVLVIGLGGGGLCTLLQQLYPQVVVTAVDIDPAIVDVAKNYYGVSPNKTLHLEARDGLEYIASKRQEGVTFDIVIFDVDSKEIGAAIACPPPSFLESKALENVAALIGETGTLVMNIVSRVESEKERVLNDMRRTFHLIARCTMEEDVNEVIFATCRKDLTKEKWRKELEKAAKSLNLDGKVRLSRDSELLNLNHLIRNLDIK